MREARARFAELLDDAERGNVTLACPDSMQSSVHNRQAVDTPRLGDSRS